VEGSGFKTGGEQGRTIVQRRCLQASLL
jgi:hypothetical protein